MWGTSGPARLALNTSPCVFGGSHHKCTGVLQVWRVYRRMNNVIYSMVSIHRQRLTVMGRTSRSDVIKQGRTRAPHRAFLRAMGLGDADIAKPFVAVMGPYGELTPCNLHIGALMRNVKTGIAEAGG